MQRPVLLGFCLVCVLVLVVFGIPNEVDANTIALAILAGAVLFGSLIVFYRSFRSSSLRNILACAIESNTQPVFITKAPLDIEEPFIFTNQAFKKMFPTPNGVKGLTSFKALRNFFDFNEAALGELARLQQMANTGVSGHAELSIRGERGKKDWLHISIQPFPVLGERSNFVLWRAQDITAQHEIDEARRLEEKTFSDFLDNLPAGFFSADSDGNIIYANNKFVEWLGVSFEELRTRGLRFADFVVAGSPDAALGGPETGVNGDVTLRGPGGSLFKACLVQSEHIDENDYMNYSRSVLLRDLTWREGLRLA